MFLPEITKDLKSDKTNDTCSITLYPTDGEPFEFSRKRSEITPFLKGVLSGGLQILGLKKPLYHKQLICALHQNLQVYIFLKKWAVFKMQIKTISLILYLIHQIKMSILLDKLCITASSLRSVIDGGKWEGATQLDRMYKSSITTIRRVVNAANDSNYVMREGSNAEDLIIERSFF